MRGQLDLRALWERAESVDPSLRVARSQLPLIQKKLVRPRIFSRQQMFRAMATRAVGIFTGVPVRVATSRNPNLQALLFSILSKMFPRGTKARVQTGPSQIVKHLNVTEVMRRWAGGRAIVGVTDLHVRGTRVETMFDTNALSSFNLLIRGSEELGKQEMMTLVIASSGNLTDSHSDDPDGTNHCFLGTKLWLAWDTFEGMEAGLEDVERQDIYGRCRFDMATFLRLKSSRWFLVADGQTLFLPGNLTHKVLTLKSYIGIGSFHVALPSALDSLSRWLFRGPLWSSSDPDGEHSGLVDELAQIVLQRAKTAKRSSKRIQERWGYDYLQQSYRNWKRCTSRECQRLVLEHSAFREFAELAADSVKKSVH